MADEAKQVIYEVSMEGAEEAIRALKEGEAKGVERNNYDGSGR